MTDIEISNDKYINANDFIKKCIQDYYDKAVDFDFLITEIAEMPSADVVEVKHGEWENKLPDGWQCSECFEIIPLRFMVMFCWGGNRMNFCPRCGADMRERKETDDSN